MASRITITGLSQLRQSLAKLADDMQHRAGKRAVGAGARVVRDEVKAKAAQQPTLADRPFVHEGVTYQPGHIAQNVIAKGLREPEPGDTASALVAVRSKGGAGKIGALNEFGTVNMAPQPFMRPGFEASKGAAVSAIVESLRRSVK